MSALDRQANLLGAFALVVADRTADAMTSAAGEPLSHTAASALSALHHFLDQPSLDLLRQVLGLTASGTVRLVDRLVELGYAERGDGPDGRSRSITLTSRGREAAQRITEARASVLSGALQELTSDERAAFDGAIGKIMAGFVRGPGATKWICRACDTTACGRDRGRCPTANAAMAKIAAQGRLGDDGTIVKRSEQA
ncbi:MAG TPA: MarR family transcriptional regulator [Jiangellaceae bacterium]